MANGLQQSHRTETGVGLRVDPRMVLSSNLLHMSGVELQQAVETELLENPALEQLDPPSELSELDLLHAVAPTELRIAGDTWESARSLPDPGETHWTEMVESPVALGAHLEAQLLLRLPSSLHAVAHYLVACLDDRGYLPIPVEEVALDANCSLEAVEQVLKVLQSCDPVGVGARDVQECLLLQLRGGNSTERKLARSIVREHLEELRTRNISRISRRYGVMPSVVESAIDLIVSLNPFPGDMFAPANSRSVRSKSVVADLKFSRTEQGWVVEASGPEPASLTVNRYYQERLESLKGRGSDEAKSERKHLGSYMARAGEFIHCLKMRRQTLLRIGEFLIAQQGAFLNTGDFGFLRTMTRANIATALGLHESTISRATAGKFVELANGEVVSFEVFFKPSLRLQKMIRDILSTENPAHPLSDERIAELLQQRGVVVARRTVNKYRDRGRSLSSRKRRVA